MKRIIISLLGVALVFTFLLTNNTLAQGLTAKGIKAGLNISNARGDNVPDDFESKMAFAAGGFLVYSINDKVAFRPEVLYSMKGGKVEDGGFTVTYSLNYLEIPVLFQYTIPTTGSFRPNIFAGPALGLELSSKVKVEYDGQEDEDDLEDVKSTDFGFVFGAGAVINDRITLDVRYNLGLTSIDDSDDDDDVKNTAISIMIGFCF